MDQAIQALQGLVGLEEGHRRLAVFGLMGTLNSEAGVIIFVLLLVYLIILEFGFENLERWARENGVEELLEKLKEELMMMGILSFTIFIYQEATGGIISKGSKIYTYYLAFELSHVILLFIAIAFIFQASYLLSYAIGQGRSYLKSKRISAAELVEMHSDMQSEKTWEYWAFHNLPWWFPSNYPKIKKRIEVKIIERIFLEYQKRREDFRFAHYISKLFQAYIAELGKVSTRSWLIIAMLVVLNYCRIVALDKSWNAMDYCDDHVPGEESHRRLGGGANPCIIYLYGYALFISWMVPIFCFAVLVFAKYYKTRVIDIGLGMLGVNPVAYDRQNYVDALIELQKVEEVASRHVEALNAAKHGGDHGSHGKAKPVVNPHFVKDVEGTVAVGVHDDTFTHELQAFKDNMKIRFEKEFDMDFDAREGRKCLPYLQHIMFPKSFGYPGAIFSQVFLFDSPSTFFQHVELCLLFQSMYVSIWATQLIPLTVNNPSWAIALTIPMCCNFLIIQLLLHDAVVLKAVCEIHDNAIVETEEEEEMEETCIEKMRVKLEENYSQEKAEKERRSEFAALKHVWLEREFMKFDKDKSGEISFSELKEFLSVSLQIKFSTKELKTLWLAIDEDLSGEVQWHEFYTAIFPDEKDVIKHELEIVKTCQNLVFTRMAELGFEATTPVSDYLRGLFDKYDEDKSGSIECDEFTLLIKGITGPTRAPTDKEMRSMFAAIDFDKGGGIDFEEFEKLLTPPRDKLQKVFTRVQAHTTTSPVEIATGEEGTAVQILI